MAEQSRRRRQPYKLWYNRWRGWWQEVEGLRLTTTPPQLLTCVSVHMCACLKRMYHKSPQEFILTRGILPIKEFTCEKMPDGTEKIWHDMLFAKQDHFANCKPYSPTVGPLDHWQPSETGPISGLGLNFSTSASKAWPKCHEDFSRIRGYG